MADILPIRPWRYNRKLSASLEALTSPLFDVVSDKQRKVLYQQPYNSIHLSAPEPSRGEDHAAKLLQEWKRDGIFSGFELDIVILIVDGYRIIAAIRDIYRTLE